MEWRTLIVSPLEQMLSKITGFIPTLIGALLILIVGWVVAKIIKKVVYRLLRVIQFDKIADKAGISNVLIKGGIKLTVTQMMSVLAYWLVMIMVLVMVVNALGLAVASQLLEGLLDYIPNVIAALFVLVLGLCIANFISGIVHTAASNANLPRPQMLGGISRWAIIIFAGTVSLRELGIAPELVISIFSILFGGICLALALAFGLGGKDIAAKYLEELKKKRSE
jgi:hypothetical protein